MEAPPILAADSQSTSPPEPSRPPIAKWRWATAWILLAAYPLAIAALHHFATPQSGEAQSILPGTLGELLMLSVQNMVFFAILAGVCWLLTRPTREQLRLVRLPGIKGWGLAFGYSIAARLLAVAPVLVVLLVKVAQGESMESAIGLRAKVENVVAIEPLMDPLYLLFSVTILSFVVAGLREELWRAGMIAAGEMLCPARWSSRSRGIVVVGVSALIFGLGHLSQGPVGVFQITIVGAAFGAVLLFHRSTWVAVISHGFFDAATFLMLRAIKESGQLEKLLGK